MKSSQSIGCNEHDHFVVGGMARALRIDMDKRFGDKFAVPHAVYSWILRHSGWFLNPFLCRQRWLQQPSKDTRAESTMTRCAISLNAFCSRFSLWRRQSRMTSSVLAFGLGEDPEG